MKGRCWNCRKETLFLGEGGYVTCGWAQCSNPALMDDVLHREAGSSPDYEAAAEAWFNIEAGIEDLEFGEELRWSEIDQIVREDYIRKAIAAIHAAFPNREGGSTQ